MVWEILWPALLSCLVTSLAVPLTIKLAFKYGLVDDPNKRPHPAHLYQEVKPRAGGLPIYIGIVLVCLLALPLTKSLIGIILGITILLAVGLIDDKVRTFNPYVRLGLLVVAGLVAVGSGIGISFINNPLAHFMTLPAPFNSPILRLDEIIIPIKLFGVHNIVLIADLFALLWITSLTQVINWAKGVDGQMPSITFIAALILGFLSLKLFLNGDVNQLNIAKLAFIVSGSSLGFLFFNWYPSRIFPGFAASTILAFMLAVLSILSGAKLATASLALAIPIIDFLYTFFRRILQKKSPVWGDRGHLHHKLLDLGWSPRQISLFYMGTSAILGGLALLIDSQGKFFALTLVSICVYIFILWINSFGDWLKK